MLTNTKINFNCLASNLVTFIVSFLYSFFLIKFNKPFDNYTTLLFLGSLAILFLFELRNIKQNKVEIIDLVFKLIFLSFGIMLGYSIAQGGIQEIWIIDAQAMHVPGAINISNFISGTEPLRKLGSVFDKIYLTNAYVGIWFYIFGASPEVSMIALTSMKCLTTYFLYLLTLEIFNKQCALIASLIYTIVPTLLFYSITYYKEMLIQLCITMFCLGLVRLNKSFDIKNIALLLVSLLTLSNERFYLFPILGGTLFLRVILINRIPNSIKYLTFLISLSLAALFQLKYQEQIPIQKIISSIQQFHKAYNNYSDVNSGVSSLYPISLVRFVFTPFFTFNKFDLFHNYSYLLIWGSFFNQAIIATAIYTILIKSRNLIKEYWYLFLPSLFFIFLFAYIAPYSGRLRDTFYPLVCLWASYQINNLKIWKQNEK